MATLRLIQEKMKKEITLGQLLAVGTTVLITILSAWLSLSKQVALDAQKNVDQDKEIYNMRISNDNKFNKIDDKLDNIIEKLADKQNRQ